MRYYRKQKDLVSYKKQSETIEKNFVKTSYFAARQQHET